MGGTRVPAGGRRAARSCGLGRPEGGRDVGESQRGARDSNLRRDARAVAPVRRGRWLVEAPGLRSRVPLRPEVCTSRRRGVEGMWLVGCGEPPPLLPEAVGPLCTCPVVRFPPCAFLSANGPGGEDTGVVAGRPGALGSPGGKRAGCGPFTFHCECSAAER